MTNKNPLTQYTPLLKKLHKIAKKNDCYLIARIQKKRAKQINVLNEKLESVKTSNIIGIGMRVFTKTGHNAFGATDNMNDDNEIVNSLKQIISLAKKSQKFNFATNKEIFRLKPIKDIVIPETEYAFSQIKTHEIEKILIDINKETKKLIPAVAETIFNIEEEIWRISRTDGTDIIFKIPRSSLYSILTYKKNNKTIQRHSRIGGLSYEILLNKKLLKELQQQIKELSEIMPKLINAPIYKSGNYDLLLDAELAGTLIHEAFGHATESDVLYQGSILSKNKKILKNKKVASSIVSIYDYAKENERGFYPYDSQGVKRKKITIVQNGILKQSISDIYTAKKINAPLTGGSKAEFYNSVPVPRMSNTILEIKNIISDENLSNISIQNIQKNLIKNNILKTNTKIILLQGGGGGQVDTQKGTFMLGSNVLYELTKKSIRMFQPSSFSGTTLKTLQSIKFAIGKKKSIGGTCGKAGQWAPCSETSNEFIFIQKNKEINIGGK